MVPRPAPSPFFAGGTARGCSDACCGRGCRTGVLTGIGGGRWGCWDLVAAPYTLLLAGRGMLAWRARPPVHPGALAPPGPAAGAPTVHRASCHAPSLGAFSLLSPHSSQERTLDPDQSDTLPIAPQPPAAAQGALEVHSATLGHLPGTGGDNRSPAAPSLLLCKLFAKAFISAAKMPCTRVVVATPSRRTGPSVAGRHAACFLRRPLRKAPLYPRFGGFLSFPCPSPAAPSQAATFTKALSCARSLLLCPGLCTDAPWDGSGQGGSAGSNTPNFQLQQGDLAG